MMGVAKASDLSSSMYSMLPPIGESSNENNSSQLLTELDQLKKDFKRKKLESDKTINQKNTKINDLMTELENTKTDLNYTNKQLRDSSDKYSKINGEIISMHSNYDKIIATHEKDKSSLKEQIAASLLKDIQAK
jgi:septal ring factor EnvC (AmiA/AmiB activator)